MDFEKNPTTPCEPRQELTEDQQFTSCFIIFTYTYAESKRLKGTERFICHTYYILMYVFIYVFLIIIFR